MHPSDKNLDSKSFSFTCFLGPFVEDFFAILLCFFRLFIFYLFIYFCLNFVSPLTEASFSSYEMRDPVNVFDGLF